MVLVTDVDGDHLDVGMIARLRDEEAVVVGPAAAAGQFVGATALANGETAEISGIGIEATPMYNLHRGPEEGQVFHEKGRGNGYLLTVGGKRIYIAGDTACTPEMKALEGIDVAFVPMNLPYTMPPAEAAECVRAFQPRHRLSLPLPGLGFGGVRAGIGRNRDRGPPPRLVLLDSHTSTLGPFNAPPPPTATRLPPSADNS